MNTETDTAQQNQSKIELFPPLALADWEATKDTLQLWTQIVGKIRMAQTPLVNHFWNVTLYVSARGLTTSAMPYHTGVFEIEFDFIEHNLVIKTSKGATEKIKLEPKTVKRFYEEVFTKLNALGINPAIRDLPDEIPNAIPFTNDEKHKSYDPEYANRKGERLDGRDLPTEWMKKYQNSGYVWNKQQFDQINAKKTKHLLGLFEPSQMKHEYDRPKDEAGEPSLTEMTTKAIDIVSNNKKGYFLMVEAGRIDHAHHDGNAFRALTDTIELSNAVRAALKKVNLNETLIVVTADHSHAFTMAGYPIRGNNILGLVREVGSDGLLEEKAKSDRNKQPFTTLGYANGKGYVGGARPNLSQETVTNPDYRQEATVPLNSETHGGEDVAIFATGAGSYLIHGVMEENWIFYAMKEALQLKNY